MVSSNIIQEKMNSELLMAEEKIMNNYINRYQRRNFFYYDTPMTISFLVTNRCNLRCQHCFNNKTVNKELREEKELTLDDYEKLSKSLKFVASGLFCGGEPFIRTDLHKIVNIFKNNCNMQYSSTTTNGILQDSILDQTEKIVSQDKRKRFVLNFSIDGYEREHDITRGEGVYKKCIETILEVNKLKKKYKNLQTGIVTTMTTINEEIVADFFEYISEEVKPDVISLLKVRQSPRGGEYLKDINLDNYKKAKDKLIQLFVEGKNGNPNSPVGYYPLAFYDIIEKSIKHNLREFYCYAGIHGAYIDYNGFVNACEILGDRECSDNPVGMGNLRDYGMDFGKLWNSEEAQKARNYVNRHKCCENCTHETEGILPSIYFEPNSIIYQERMKKIVREYKNF